MVPHPPMLQNFGKTLLNQIQAFSRFCFTLFGLILFFTFMDVPYTKYIIDFQPIIAGNYDHT